MVFKAELSKMLSKQDDRRYVIVDPGTGEILDDSQGYGYKSIQKAYEGYAYKIQSSSQKNRELKIRRQVSRIILEHPDFSRILEERAAQKVVKNSFLNLEDLNDILQEAGIDLSSCKISKEDFLRYL